MKRAQITAYMREDLIDWLEKKVEEGRFRSKSHGIEESVQKMKMNLEELKKPKAF